jgi:hypothetical protein
LGVRRNRRASVRGLALAVDGRVGAIAGLAVVEAAPGAERQACHEGCPTSKTGARFLIGHQRVRHGRPVITVWRPLGWYMAG